MLFAVDYNSQDYKNGVVIGRWAAGIICGLWPLVAGFRKGRPVTGIVGSSACLPCGQLFGCLLALPVAFLFSLLIGAMGRPKPRRGNDFRDGPFDYHARGRRPDW